MLVSQISVFLENSSGRLFSVSDILAKNDINVRAVSVADTTDFGILRMIVNDPEKAYQVLRENKFTVRITKVVAVEIDDTPGSMASVLKELNDHQIEVEYMYAFLGNHAGNALVILKIDDPEKVEKIATMETIKLVSADEVYKL
ncbi:MAG: amino acid-binding protein [Clostridia bacterium]|nr:amino acid-binding protein [Clostridia bacterium]